MLEEIIEKICSETGISKEDVMDKIIDKQAEHSGLISEEGAAYMVAKEVGADLLKQNRLNIESLVPDMQNVEIMGKIIRIIKRDFDTEKAKGSVANVHIADNTGSVRLILWNDEIERLGGFNEGDVLSIKGYVKEGMNGLEMRLGRFGNMQRSNEAVEACEIVSNYNRYNISDISEGVNVSVRGCIVQVFESNPFYEVCPQCGARVKSDEKNEYTCESHGVVEPSYNLVITGVIDDGTENMRAVFFRDMAEHVINMTTEQARQLFMKKMEKSVIYSKVLLGRDFVFQGQCRRNKVFDRVEFIVNDIKGVDIKKEIEDMLEN